MASAVPCIEKLTWESKRDPIQATGFDLTADGKPHLIVTATNTAYKYTLQWDYLTFAEKNSIESAYNDAPASAITLHWFENDTDYYVYWASMPTTKKVSDWYWTAKAEFYGSSPISPGTAP